VNIPGASQWFRGGIVSYASALKYDLLGVTPGPVVSASVAEEMAHGARSLLGCDVVVSVTGVAGHDAQDDQVPGTVFVGISIGDAISHVALRLPGDSARVRSYGAISALNALRQALDRLP